MTISWWLHRLLIITLTMAGLLGGAYAGLHSASILSRIGGADVSHHLLVALLPLCAIVGAGIPQLVFRKWIHAGCPVDGATMVLERFRIHPEGPDERVGKSVSRYRCPICGLTK